MVVQRRVADQRRGRQRLVRRRRQPARKASSSPACKAAPSITQSFTADASTLHLGWPGAGRACCSGSNDQTYQVTLNGSRVSGVMSTVGGSDFSFNMLTLSGLTASTAYTLGFQGLAGSDKTSFIDNVVLQDSIFPPAPTAPTRPSPPGQLPATDPGVPSSQHVVDSFTDPVASGYAFSSGYVRSEAPDDPSVSAPPPGDLTNYETVLGGRAPPSPRSTRCRLQLLPGVRPMATTPSICSAPGGYHWTLAGTAIWGSSPPGNGDQSIGRRVALRLQRQSGGQDRLLILQQLLRIRHAGRQRRVLKPATWGLMILGFSAMGAVLRRRQNRARRRLRAPSFVTSGRPALRPGVSVRGSGEDRRRLQDGRR